MAEDRLPLSFLFGQVGGPIIADRTIGKMDLQQRTKPYRAARNAALPECVIDAGPYRVSDRVKPCKRCRVEQFHRGKTRAHRDGISGKGAAVWQRRLAVSWVENRHELLAAGDGADRKTAAYDLPQSRQVGIDVPQSLRPVISQPERDDLIENQQRSDFAGDPAQRVEIGFI